MSDVKKGLSVRSEMDADERLQSKLVDYTSPANGLEIDSDGNAHVEMHGNNPAGTDVVERLSELGHSAMDGVYHATNNTDPSQVGLVALVPNASPADSQQTARLTAATSGDTTVRALHVALKDEAGEDFTALNPLFVQEVVAGDDVVSYDTTAAVAEDASDNHDYTVTALKTLQVERIMCAASGRAKYEVRKETGVGTGIFNTVAVKFSSVANPHVDFEFHKALKVNAGVILRVVRTNTEKGAQDVYSTIVGVEV